MSNGTVKVEVIGLTATDSAFAALKQDGSVAVWGSAAHGGDAEQHWD